MNELKDAFLDAAIELPKDIDPVKKRHQDGWTSLIEQTREDATQTRNKVFGLDNL